MTGMTGPLEQVLRSSPYAAWLDAELVELGPGRAVVRATPRAAHANLAGTVHGGFVTGLADCAFEVACNTHGPVCVAVQLDAHFATGAELERPLTATAREVSRGPRLASYDVRVVQVDGQGQEQLVAWLQAVAYRTRRSHLP